MTPLLYVAFAIPCYALQGWIGRKYYWVEEHEVGRMIGIVLLTLAGLTYFFPK